MKTSGLIKTAWQLYGVPYALPPVNELRFKIPFLFDEWKDEMYFGHYKPICFQFSLATDATWDPGVSEDCLYMNIWAPREAIENGEKLPVQVYFHGGSYNMGTNMFRDTDGTILADRQNIITVWVVEIWVPIFD